VSENKIVFRKSKRQDLLKLDRPPIWWENRDAIQTVRE